MLEQKKRTFAHAIVQWCNGSTTGFGSVCGGSNPPWTTLNPNRSLQHRFFNFILATCSPAARSRLPASCPSFFLDVARYACKKTTANLLGQPTTISSGSNDRFGLKSRAGITSHTAFLLYYFFFSCNFSNLNFWQVRLVMCCSTVKSWIILKNNHPIANSVCV